MTRLRRWLILSGCLCGTFAGCGPSELAPTPTVKSHETPGVGEDRRDDPIPAPLLVEIRGEEFRWRYRYAGPDGRFATADDRVSTDALRLPRDYAIEMQTASEDYVYSLRVQPLQLSQIAVPGLSYSLEFQTPATGQFDMPSDPMCGLRFFHDDSMGHMQVIDQRAFREWWNHPASLSEAR